MANLANRQNDAKKKLKRLTKPWQMGTLCVLVLWTKVALALEGLNSNGGSQFKVCTLSRTCIHVLSSLPKAEMLLVIAKLFIVLYNWYMYFKINMKLSRKTSHTLNAGFWWHKCMC